MAAGAKRVGHPSQCSVMSSSKKVYFIVEKKLLNPQIRSIAFPLVYLTVSYKSAAVALTFEAMQLAFTGKFGLFLMK
jgi:hypothetical protein